MATLKYVPQYFTTKLNVGGGINDSQTTGIVLLDVSGVDTSKPGQICISYSDPLDTSDAEWIDYTSINGSNELVGAVRGREGYSAKTHLQDATVAFVVSASHHNDIVDLLNGTESGIKIKTALYDANGNEVIKTPATTSAVNEITVTNSATGNAVQISATGDDTNINLKLAPKGTGAILDKNDEALSPNQSLFAQLLRNPNMEVVQRGTSFSLTMSATKQYTLDRWSVSGGSTAAVTISQQAITDLVGSSFCARIQRNAGQTNTGAINFGQSVETRDTLKVVGKKITLSFWARKGANYSATSDVMKAYIGTGTGVDENFASITGFASTNEAKTLTTTWQKFTVTTANVLAGTVKQLHIFFEFIPTGTAGAADYFEITQVDLCAGDVALPFQPKSFEEELRACRRYYMKFDSSLGAYTYFGMGYNASTTRAYIYIPFPTRMRIAPTALESSAANTMQIIVTPCTGVSIDVAGCDGTSLSCDVSGGLTAGQGSRLLASNSTSAYLGFPAEL